MLRNYADMDGERIKKPIFCAKHLQPKMKMEYNIVTKQ